ncbi:MAG TPA: transcription termination/antitermination protein NusA [Verrucomicrobiales bacterium]|nr:transcription termination/antitermination protein NusA [Bryobacterales bacterium]HCN77009.1 transcription termination/antitermination protein NusA [Verrucomicrobiales bacterium]HRJ09431.1 transcription termination factor NusA [Prosthecobacter sp.]HRK16141.1 transcription termination factor NusA [Prosthecobacter sp.]
MISELKSVFEYYDKEKGIDREKMVDALQLALLAASKKSIGPARELRIVIDPDKGTIKAWARLIVVETVSNPWEEIAIEKARRVKKDAQVGDELDLEVTPKNMGRIAAQTAKQTMLQRLRMAEKENLYDEFKDRTGDVVNGTIRRFDKSDVVVDLGKFEGVMPSKERVSTEDYTPGDRMRFYVKAVEKDGTRGPEIILSRAHVNFVRRLFEFEVSEIGDRTVEIASIAREPGYRTKVAVHSADDKVDPVGACVGMRGARVKNIVRELNNEKVDIIKWSPDPATFIREALKPVKVLTIQVAPDKSSARLTVSDEDLSKAIGRRGQNARLTTRLVGMELNIERDEHAAEVFEGQMDTAAHELETALGINLDTARKLIQGGLGDIGMLMQVELEDISDALNGDEVLAAQVHERIQSYIPKGAQP